MGCMLINDIPDIGAASAFGARRGTGGGDLRFSESVAPRGRRVLAENGAKGGEVLKVWIDGDRRLFRCSLGFLLYVAQEIAALLLRW